MEVSGEMHSEDALMDKNKKRIVKTSAQIEALESFFDEHKYPTETMKQEVANRIGLTEKQVSSWFCHRRLKDKKLLKGEPSSNGKQDRSSGVIQDIGSGLRQDSCGSTKQGVEKNYEPREVESRRLPGQELSNADLTYERGSNHIGNFTRPDDTSSDSNSSQQNMYFKRDPLDMATSRYATQTLSTNLKGGKARSGPSGYLKLKGPVENPAITSVKRQLGRNYREDGPPLGIDFDPLPPGAFESSVQDPVLEPPYYVGDQVQRHSSGVPEIHQEHLSKIHHADEDNLPHAADASKIRKEPISGKEYGYMSKMGSQKSDLDGRKYKTMHGSDLSENSFRHKSEHKFPLSKHRSMDVHDGSASEIAFSDRKVKYETGAISGRGGFRTDTIVGHQTFQPYGGEGNQKRARPWSDNNSNKAHKVPQGDNFRSDASDLPIKGSKKFAKVAKIYGERTKVEDDRDEAHMNILPKNKMRRVKDEYTDREYAVQAKRENVPQWTNHQIKRPVAEMPSSFSEDDETADTDSSVD